MPNISASQLKIMRNNYRHDVAKYIAGKAPGRALISYSELTDNFGGIDRGWGNVLGGIALRCSEANLPILSVLVVNKHTGLPSVDAVLYEDLGLKDEEQIKAEQERCFNEDWSKTPLGR